MINNYPNITDRVAVVTGASGGIGRALSVELCRRGVKAIALVDNSEAVNEIAVAINQEYGRQMAMPFVGNVVDDLFTARTFSAIKHVYGLPTILVPCAGITRDRLAVKWDKEKQAATIYSLSTFRDVMDVNLVHPVNWAMHLIAGILSDRQDRGLKRWSVETESVQGNIVFIGSVSSLGNPGQVSYAATKAGLVGAAATLQMEGMFHGIRCSIIHPGYTDTPMVRSLGQPFIENTIKPRTQLKRLLKPEEIASTICFMIENESISGEIWADGGWKVAP